MIEFNGEFLETVAPVRIDDISVSSVRLSPTARQRPVIYGADFVRMSGGSRTVTITLALLTNDRIERQKQIMNMAAWAQVGNVGRLTLSDFPGLYLECACTEYPSPSVKQWWESKLRFVFTTYNNPYWTEIGEKSAACGTTIRTTGSAPDGPLMRIEHTVESVTDLTYSNGTESMTFQSVPAGNLVIDLNEQTARVNGNSIMDGYTLTSSFVRPKRGAQTINGSGTVYWRERWL